MGGGSRWVVMGTLLLGLTAAACGGDDEGLAGDAGSVAGMLDQLPASGSMRDQVIYGNLARLREAAGIDPPTGAVDDYVHELIDAASNGWVVAEPFRTRALSGDFTAEIGFDLTDIDASIEAGLPPDQLAIFAGRIDDGAVDRALTTFEPFADDLDRDEQDGVTTYRFGEEGEFQIENISAARPLGESLRLGVTAGSVLWTRSDAVLDEAIEVSRGDGRSLADVDGFRETADALDEAAVHTAVLLGDPSGFGLADPTVILGDDVTPEQIEAMEAEIAATAVPRWEVAAVAERLMGDDYEMLIVLWHADADAATTSAERLEAQLLEGQSFRTGEPWSTLCSDPTVEHDGQLVTATCTLDTPGRAVNIAFARDSLLVWR